MAVNALEVSESPSSNLIQNSPARQDFEPLTPMSFPLGTVTALCAIIVLFLGFGVAVVAAWRLCFHPLRNFPGPRLAAVTSLYRVYYEVILGGEFLSKVVQLHDTYGPVVRIGPNELHFNDPRAYSSIYNTTSQKDPSFYHCFGAGESAFGTPDLETSKAKRALLRAFFSRKAILDLEDVLQLKVQKLVHRLNYHHGRPVDMFFAYRALTLDIISFYIFGQCTNALDTTNFAAPILFYIQSALPMLWVIKSFSWASWTFPFVSLLSKPFSVHFNGLISLRSFIGNWVHQCILNDAKLLESSNSVALYHRFLLPGRDTTPSGYPQYVIDEAISLLQAGSDTVGNACTTGTAYILQNPTVFSRLFQELQTSWPDGQESIRLSELERLPYLTAVIKESLRLSHGFVSPLPRIVGSQGALISGVHVPQGTVVGMSVVALHLNDTVFHDAKCFIPERWLQPGSSEQLDRYLVSFSRGPRMCIGTNLAWAELYLTFGTVFRKVRMELIQARQDPQNFKDYFAPYHKESAVRVQIATK